ncbi:MAG: ATP-binding protein [Acidobacteriota bacterium]|nr:ATP-binding protein [Acidobacteriota bacterium]
MKPASITARFYLLLSGTLFFTVGSHPAFAQYRLSSIDWKQGLSESHVFSIIQDRMGFMWFATRDGLNRWDGYEMRVFRHDREKPDSLANSYIYTIYEDDEGVLWVGTRGGLHRYNHKTQGFDRFQHDPEDPETLTQNTVFSIRGNGDGKLWVGTIDGLNLFDPKTGKAARFEHDPDDDTSLSSAAIMDLLLDPKGRLWIATESANRLDTNLANKVTRYDNGETVWTYAFYRDRQGRLWAGCQTGLYRMTEGSGKDFTLEEDVFGVVNRIGRGPDNKLWLGTRNKGLFLFDPDNGSYKQWQDDPSSTTNLGNNCVNAVFQQDNGALWVGTYGSGVRHLQPVPFGHIPSRAPTDAITSMVRDEARNLWFGKAGGLERLEDGAGKPVLIERDGVEKPYERWVKCLLVDSKNRLWVGTETNGVDVLDIATNRWSTYRHDPNRMDSLANDGVFGFFEDAAGTVWVGTRSGLNTVAPDKPDSLGLYQHSAQDPDSLSHNDISFLGGTPGDSYKPLWIGTWEGGLNRMDWDQPGRFTAYRHQPGDPNSLSNDTIFCVTEDSRGRIWVGTSQGLNLLDPFSGQARRFLARDGLSSNVIYKIMEDGQGLLWLSTPNGLSRFNPQDKSIRNFDRNDGLMVEDFRENSGISDPSGVMLLGGQGGVVAFDPNDVVPDPRKPGIVITHLALNNKNVLPDPESRFPEAIETLDELQLHWRHRVFELRFASLAFAAPVKNRYRHKLEGFDPDWIETDAFNRLATYTNLDSGTYTFRLTGTNKDGTQSQEMQLKIHVPPPPWKSPWAISLYVLGLVGSVGWYLRMQKNKLAYERKINERLRQVDALKDEFLAGTSHELRTPLHGIIGIADSLLDGIAGDLPNIARENLLMIASSGRRLSNLVNDLLDFSKLRNHTLKLVRSSVKIRELVDMVLVLNEPAAREKGLHLVNAVPEGLPPVPLDEDRMHQIMHNLVGNAVKFTDKGSVAVAAEIVEDRVVVLVSDTGIGISEADQERIFLTFEQLDGSATRSRGGTGLGLALCKQLVELHGGTISVTSEEGKGSIFQLNFPLEAPEQEIAGVETFVQDRTNLPAAPVTIEVQPPAGDQSFQVLVVDDEPVNRQVLRNQLVLMGHQVTEAGDGQEALDILEEKQFDLVLLDIMMPRISGYEVCSRIRRKLGPHELPVIFLSARNQVTDLTAGFKAGANDYLSKPTDRTELAARIDLHLRLRASVKDLDEHSRAMSALSEELRALDEIVRKMNREMSLDGVLQGMLEAGLAHIPEAEAGAVFLWNDATDRFEMAAVSGYAEDPRERRDFSPEKLSYRYLRTEGNQDDKTCRVHESEENGEPHNMLSMPLRLEGELRGFLVLDNFSEDKTFSNADIRKLDRFREHCVSALAKANYLRQIQEKHESLLQAQKQMVLQEKMVSLGTLTSGIGHEINNPTNYVHGSAQSLELDLKEFRKFLFELAGEDAHPEVMEALSERIQPLFEHAKLIRDGSQRIADIVSDLRIYARRSGGDFVKVDVNNCLESTMNLVRLNYKEYVEIIEDYREYVMLMGNQGELNQVFMNLAVNACQAIKSKARREGSRGKLIVSCYRENSWGVIRFVDTGGGIPEGIRSRIFEPFFTTKTEGEGTGLGLSISFGIIQRHQGRVEVESDDGRGTTFTVHIPLEQQPDKEDMVSN